jgi:hypothetical protein
MTNLATLAMTANRLDRAGLLNDARRAVAARILDAVLAGDAEMVADAVTDGLALHCGVALIPMAKDASRDVLDLLEREAEPEDEPENTD